MELLSRFCINTAGCFIIFKSGGFPFGNRNEKSNGVIIPLSKTKIANHKYFLFYSP